MIRLRVTASWKACCTAGVGAPSPKLQHGAETRIDIGKDALPSALAVIVATPPESAFRVAVSPAAWIETTRLFEVLHTTVRSLSAFPIEHFEVSSQEFTSIRALQWLERVFWRLQLRSLSSPNLFGSLCVDQ